ncbi:MAG: aldehyde dehydrogenase family protein, partial [Myxococcales bacterium]|nr:aldehyde dehydrogenase family protein [Myxococcales bacterium]
MAVLENRNPATGEPLPPVEVTTPDQLQQTLAAARAAQVEWAARDFESRAEFAARLVERVSDPAIIDELARVVATEMGKPMRHARAEIANIRGRSGAFVERAREACRDEVGVEGAIEVTTQWRPLGVVAVIAPWNFPLSTPNNLTLSALLTGNAVVLKPSEFTPRSGARYFELIADLLPPGLVGLVQGGGEVGRGLVESAVDMVAFTGSIRTGQAIMREAANGMKRLVLELGGKDPMIVLPGADLEAAAKHASVLALANAGQACISVERVIVHRSLV